jgi:hypothetical protein
MLGGRVLDCFFAYATLASHEDLANAFLDNLARYSTGFLMIHVTMVSI